MNTFLPLTITLLAMFLANATAKAGVFHVDVPPGIQAAR